MPKSEIFRLNYYVGAMLAQGGQMWYDDSKIVFSPTSMLDRALGATDVEIPFLKIQAVEFKGELMRMFQVKTADKLHRFHGTQAKKAWEGLSRTLQEVGMKPIQKIDARRLACSQCSGQLESNFSFCPFCGARVV